MRLYDASGRLITVAAIDATPINGNTDIPTSSDWAYDHAADVSAHHEKYTDAEAVIAAKTVKLDDFTATEDNTDLDAATAKHGLMPKLDKVKLDGIEALAVALATVLANADVADAISKKHSSSDVGTHETDTSAHGAADIADVSDIAVDANLSAAAQAAIAASHTQGTDTALGTQTETLDMGNNKISNVVDPAVDQDAATKKYIDDLMIAVGAGDMLKSEYDPDADGIIALAELDATIPVLIENAKILAMLGV